MDKKDANPGVIGRFEDGTTDERAATVGVCTVKVSYIGGAIGSMSARLFESKENMDRGGIVLRLECDDAGSSWFPHAKTLPNGIELHFAGDAEAAAVAMAVVEALKHFKAGPRFGLGIESINVAFDLETER